MKKYKVTYRSMTASYDFGTVMASSKEEAERYVRAKQTAFTQSEKSLIKAHEVR
jgi:hypothetical protein